MATNEERHAERVAQNEANERLIRALLDQDTSADCWPSKKEFAIALKAEIKERGSGVDQVRAICAKKMGKGPASHATDI